MKKICVYTCITGNYDKLKELKFKEKGIDYICFTNNKTLISKTWRVVYIDNDGLSNHLLARRTKILGHPIILDNYDFSVYIDGCMQIAKSLRDFINKYDLLNYDFSGFVHSNRNCIYEEAKECIKLRKDNEKTINEQMERYKREKYPKNNGLIESTILFRKMNEKKVKETMELWFSELVNGSIRDQLSFNYVISKTGLLWNKIHLKVFDNEYFSYTPHTSRNNLSYYDTMYMVYKDIDNEADDQSRDVGIYNYFDDCFVTELHIPKNIKQIIFIPVINSICFFSRIKITSKNKELKYKILSNNIEMDNGYLILDFNPRILIEVGEDNNIINVEISMYIADPIAIVSHFNKKITQHGIDYDNLLNENKKLIEENKKLIEENKKINECINGIINSKG